MVATAPGTGSPETDGGSPGGNGPGPTGRDGVPHDAGTATSQEAASHAPAEAPAGRRRGLLWLAVPVALAVLGGAGYGAAYAVDLGVRGTVSDKVQAAVSGVLADGGAVTTTLHGSWAGLQMLAGRTVAMDVDVQDLDWGGTAVDLDLDLSASQYTPTGGTATVTVPVEALTGRFGGTAASLDLAAVDGSLQFTGDVDLLLENVVLDMDLVFEDGVLTLVPTAVSADGHDMTVAKAAKNPITESLAEDLTVDLSDVPDGVTITAVALEGDQLVLDLDLAASAFAGITG